MDPLIHHSRQVIRHRARNAHGNQFADGHIPFEVARDAVAALLETGDRAKNEAVRLAAREIRHYLTELRLGEEMHNLLRDYKLEVHATFNLRPLSESAESEPEGDADDDEPAAEEEDQV